MYLVPKNTGLQINQLPENKKGKSRESCPAQIYFDLFFFSYLTDRLFYGY